MREIVTRDSMIRFLKEREPEIVMHYIGRALVAIFNRQLKDEKSDNMTSHENMRGFSSADAKSGCITAKFYIKNRKLLDWQIEKWMEPSRGYPRITKYWKQLNEVANEKHG